MIINLIQPWLGFSRAILVVFFSSDPAAWVLCPSRFFCPLTNRAESYKRPKP